MNLQLDHFSDDTKKTKTKRGPLKKGLLTQNNNQKLFLPLERAPALEHGSHNVSRWMTIFERKRRPGEALHESSPCMPQLSVSNKQKKENGEAFTRLFRSFFL